MLPYTELAIAIVFAALFAAGGDLEARDGRANPGVLWAGLSLLLSALVVLAFGGSAGWLVVAQLLLFVGIGALRAWLAR